MTDPPSSNEPTLADLAAASGLEPRTIRSWIAQGLLPPPLNRGPAARYPVEAMQRLLAIQAMRELLGMPLPEIRKELLVATPKQLDDYAERARTLPIRTPTQEGRGRVHESKSALDYITQLRAGAPTFNKEDTLPGLASSSPLLVPAQPLSAPTGFEALELRLGQGKPSSMSRSRSEEWLRIPITPDLEFSVRGPLDPEQRTRLERCATIIRNIILGSDK